MVVYKAVVLSKLLHAAPAWWGFTVFAVATVPTRGTRAECARVPSELIYLFIYAILSMLLNFRLSIRQTASVSQSVRWTIC